MQDEETALLRMHATRADAAGIAAAIAAAAEVGRPRRRKVVQRSTVVGGDQPLAVTVEYRNRQALVRTVRPGCPPLLWERRAAPAETVADPVDLPALLALQEVAAEDAERLAAASADSLTRTESDIRWQGVDIACTTRVLPDGRRLIELSAAAAQAAGLLRFALRLHADVPLPLDLTGWAASAGPEIDADASTAEALRTMAAACLEQIVANRPGMLDGSVEGVHQMRVGLRRLRALLSLFRPVLEPLARERIKETLASAQKLLGPTREWDVFVGDLLGRLESHAPGHPALERARAAATAERDAAHAEAAARIGSPDFAAIVLETAAWLLDPATCTGDADEPVGAFARRVLSKRHRKLKRHGREHEDASPESLHQMRIEAKKLRYAAEFFAGAFPKKRQKRFVKRVKAVQEVLGVVNDAAVAGDLTERVAARLQAERTDPAVVGEAVGMIRGWQFAAIEFERVRFAEVWDDYSGTARFWT